jgi:UDP-N-acetylmuramate--alanine ligase
METRVDEGRRAVRTAVPTGASEPRTALDGERLDALLQGGEDAAGRVHLLGVGGAGVSGIGRILVARGLTVSGHDHAESQMLDALRGLELGFELCAPEEASLPPEVDLVIRSAAVPKDDPQVLAAEARGVPVLKYAEVLPRLAAPERLLAVAGTHGKTTVSWMLWHALEGISEATGGPLPGALIGGISRRLRTNALAGSPGGWFCAEACEYDRTFLNLRPRGAVVTNVEADHLDCYGSLDAIRRAFACFVEEVASDGLVVLGRDVPAEVELGGRGVTLWRLGDELEVDLVGEERGCFRFRLRGPGWATREIPLAVPGHFNVENAAAALALAIGLTAQLEGSDPADLCEGAATGLERFTGVHRRFEHWTDAEEAEELGVDVVHDYAHHPTEVRVTIEAALRAFPGRPVHVLFQPHQHSRTAHMLQEFAESLRAADRVVVADVYGARVHVDGENQAGAPELVEALCARDVLAAHGGPLDASVERFLAGLPARAAALVLGAGDVELVRERLLDGLRAGLGTRAARERPER